MKLDGYKARDIVLFYDLDETSDEVKYMEFRISTYDELDDMVKHLKVWNNDFRYLGHLFLKQKTKTRFRDFFMKKVIERIFKKKNISGTGHGYVQVNNEEVRVKYWLDNGVEYDFSLVTNKEKAGLYFFVCRNGDFSLI